VTASPVMAAPPASGPPIPQVAVRLEGLTKMYGDVSAVAGIDLDIGRGEFFSLLGPSGSGKTTTLRMIAGFELPSSGRVLLAGRDVSQLPPYERDVNTVFQDYALFPHMSVQQNVEYGLMVKRVKKGEREDRARQALEMVRLGEYGDRKPGQLSGGQRQRVALARAIVNRPKVLLLDEPLGALDLKLRQEMQIELKSIQREVGITFVYVTHDQEEALTMSDRIAVMNRGVVEQLAAPEDVYERPRTSFVAGFIGVSNLMPAQVESAGGGEVRLRLESGPTVTTRGAGVRAGEHCQAVVRPEKLRVALVEEPAPAGQPSVEGVVESAVYLGTATQMIVKIPGDVPLTVLVPNADEAQRQMLPGAGARVRLSWMPEHMHVVVAANGAPPAGDDHNEMSDGALTLAHAPGANREERS